LWALLVLALGLTACTAAQAPAVGAPQPPRAAATGPPDSPAVPPPAERVTIGTSAKEVGNLPVALAQNYGLFAAEGLDVNVVVARTDVTIAALVAGEMDYTTAINTSLAAIVGGSPLVVLLSMHEKPLLYLISRPDVLDASALRGGTIGHGGTRGAHWQATVAMVKSLGLDPEQDVQLISTGDVEKGIAMLFSGSAAAVTLSPPYDSMAVKNGYYRLVDSADVLDNLPATGLVTHRSKLQQNPEQIRRVLRALLRAVQYGRDHLDDDVALIQRDWDLDRDTARLVATTIVPVFNPMGEVSDQILDTALDNARRDAGVAASGITARDIADWTFVREARATVPH
jgi:ABC-type nitrate/sulfonate/bicarbonate transport system substrate-binding protein